MIKAIHGVIYFIRQHPQELSLYTVEGVKLGQSKRSPNLRSVKQNWYNQGLIESKKRI